MPALPVAGEIDVFAFATSPGINATKAACCTASPAPGPSSTLNSLGSFLGVATVELTSNVYVPS